MKEFDPSQFDFDNYEMPAEWEFHEATWLVWPFNTETWPQHMSEAQEAYLDMIKALSPHEKIYLLTGGCEKEEDIRKKIEEKEISFDSVQFCNIPANDSWIRDSGPIFLKARFDVEYPLVANNFVFNAWGAKYEPYDFDNEIPSHASKLLQIPCINHEMILEGGSIDNNGRGELLTTKQCLLNPNRNAHWDESEIEKKLKHYLGVKNIHWLGEGIEGDDTDGHVDDISRFVSANQIVTVIEPRKSDLNYEPLQANKRLLKEIRDYEGNPFEIIELPMPQKRLEGPFGRSPASYANFYIANHVVLVPIYSDVNDAEALSVLGELFPDRSVIGIECSGLVTGLGSIHCVTQQQPEIKI